MLTLTTEQLHATVAEPEPFAEWYLRAVMDPLVPEFFRLPREDRLRLTLAARHAADAMGLGDVGAAARFVHFCWTLGPGFHQAPPFRQALADGGAGLQPDRGLAGVTDALAEDVLARADPVGWREPSGAALADQPLEDGDLEERLAQVQSALAREAATAAGDAADLADLVLDLPEIGRALAFEQRSDLTEATAEFLPLLESAVAEEAFAAKRAAARAEIVAIEAVLAARRRAGPGYWSGTIAEDLRFIDRALLDVGVAVAPDREEPAPDIYPPAGSGRWIDPETSQETAPGSGAFVPDPEAHPALHAALSRYGPPERGLPFREGRPDFTVFAVQDRQGRTVRAPIEPKGALEDLTAARAEAARVFGGWRKSIERGRVWVRDTDGRTMVLVAADVVTAWRRCDGRRLG